MKLDVVLPLPVPTNAPLVKQEDTAPLLEAGAVLATLAEPGRDLDQLGTDVGEIGETLRLLGRGMQHAYERAEEEYDHRQAALAAHSLWDLAQRREWTRDDIESARTRDLAAARATALRTAKRALIDLAALIGALERNDA